MKYQGGILKKLKTQIFKFLHSFQCFNKYLNAGVSFIRILRSEMLNYSNISQSGEMNASDFTDEDDQLLIFIPEVQTTFLILYGLVSLVGTVGNLFIVITVLRQEFHLLKLFLKNMLWSITSHLIQSNHFIFPCDISKVN